MYTQALYLVVSKIVLISDMSIWYQWKHPPALLLDGKLVRNVNDKFCSTLLPYKASPHSDGSSCSLASRRGKAASPKTPRLTHVFWLQLQHLSSTL